MKMSRYRFGGERIRKRGWLLLSLLCIGDLAFAESYNCGNAGGHCYAIADWRRLDTAEHYGASTDITPGQMNCGSDCDGFVTNEMWLGDDRSLTCVQNSFHRCWVEAGVIVSSRRTSSGGTEVGTDSPVFFWAHVLPQGQFNLHLMDFAPSEETHHFMIIKDARFSAQSFLIFIYNDNLSTLYSGISSVEPEGHMRANRIIIGEEVAGTRGVSTAPANFARNIFALQALGPEYVFWYQPQTTSGRVVQALPPFAEWTNPPETSSEGGVFTTHCCRP